MINPGTLVDAIVTKLRDIPELVAEVGGNAENIQAYHYRYPAQVSLFDAVYKQDQPGVLVAWRGMGPGRVGLSELTHHEFSLYLRPGIVTDADPVTAGLYALYELIINGVPTADGTKFLNVQIHPSCYEMDVPRLVISPLIVDTSGTTVDIFEIQISLTEITDT